VLIGHSMGCSLAALLASSTSPYEHLLSRHVSGVVAICPKAEPPSMEEAKKLHHLTGIPGPIFDLLRKWDRRGGVNSASVARMAGADAEPETKKLQLRFNQQSRTNVWRRMARGMLPDYSAGQPNGGIPGREVWAGLDLPVFLAAGEADTVTPAENVKRIAGFLGRDVAAIEPPSEKGSLPVAAAPFDPALVVDMQKPERKHQDSGVDAGDLPSIVDDGAAHALSPGSTHEEASIDADVTSSTDGSTTMVDAAQGLDEAKSTTAPEPHPRRLVVKTQIMPAPAAHAMLFAPTSSRIISGLIGTFLADHVDPRLSLAWQLQYLSTEGKWDVKNLKKWKDVPPVSSRIGNVFYAMKTLREVDEKHTPKVFVKEWSSKLRAVVDISHDSPVYDPRGLEEGGITYYKFPCVSKHPPTQDEVRSFIELIDKIRAGREVGDERLIGVHCHYGFNRTGFFLVSYLIERLGYRVEDAIQTFADARLPSGIKHNHFIDELYVRYSRGLKKAPTL
jgi:protein-tyrosine phosphatase